MTQEIDDEGPGWRALCLYEPTEVKRARNAILDAPEQVGSVALPLCRGRVRSDKVRMARG